MQPRIAFHFLPQPLLHILTLPMLPTTLWDGLMLSVLQSTNVLWVLLIALCIQRAWTCQSSTTAPAILGMHLVYRQASLFREVWAILVSPSVRAAFMAVAPLRTCAHVMWAGTGRTALWIAVVTCTVFVTAQRHVVAALIILSDHVVNLVHQDSMATPRLAVPASPVPAMAMAIHREATAIETRVLVFVRTTLMAPTALFVFRTFTAILPTAEPASPTVWRFLAFSLWRHVVA